MRLIDADALMEKMHRYGFSAPDMSVHEFVEDELSTIDAEPVVRCKDCVKWQTIDCPFYSRYESVMPNEEQFCSLGERRTDE